ncbi:peptide/nickel transport system permease protein [Ectothiorhodosinus mongolicus]|uniref:Peptide/nickel transport system permease protein n=1 Tax=Ectothiorhodosinus mongolicus TaxID=233100 RepID=A0A1R3VNZ3_9GAMM|nr:ABC transporter permease [Ectothiorhodosinus mongolicus]ULX56560.1 ABC transporter permease [Ectothiorhodosinus mongolicus]SIT66322.1 peptide/nickel transport system permease protein [Ectothiorhodosinus mongolicus]
MTEAQRSYTAQVVREVLLRWGARIGLAWILVLVFVAVFAPFLASSYPLLVSEGGQWSSPVLRYLSAADVTLMLTFFAALLLWRLQRAFWQKFLLLLLIAAVGGTISWATVKPPQLVIYEQYREAQAQGQYDWVIHAPIPYSPKDYLRDFGDTGLQAPLAGDSRRHWLGTEENGADVLSRMIHASRIALGIGFIATGIALGIGIVIGGLMGYFSGIVDMIGMRIVEIFEAIPTLFLLLTFVAFFGRSLYMMMIIIGITSWSGYARYVRAEFLKLREQEYVQAAIACGLPLRSVLFRHMLPNGVAPILVAASFGVASAILAEATLSFLGLGLIDDPSWGQMLNQAVQSSSFNWWMAAFPGGAIFLTVFAYNLVGESLRDALDPYLKKKA